MDECDATKRGCNVSTLKLKGVSHDEAKDTCA